MATNTENITLTVDVGTPFVVGAQAYVEQLEDGALITMVDKNGKTTAKVDDGAKGDTGDSGVHIGSTAPTDPDKNVWVDTTGSSNNCIATSSRPSDGIDDGYMIFDTTLNKPIWYKGNNVWVDATGTAV